MSSGVFNTRRPQTVEERVQALAAARDSRAAKLKSLTESREEKRQSAQMASVLEGVDTSSESENKKTAVLDTLKEQAAIKQRKNGLASLESRLFTEGKAMLWNKILFEMTYDACWIDAPVKAQLIKPLYETFSSTIDFINTTCPKSFKGHGATRLLEAMDAIVTEAAKKASKRIAKECKDDPNSDPDHINFNLNDEEEEKFNEDLQDLGKDDIAEKVKDKVLTVIQDEKDANKKKAEAMKELDDAKKEDDEDDDEDDDTIEDDDMDESDDDDSEDDEDDEDDDKKKSKKSKEDSDDDDDDEDGDKKDKKKSKKSKADDEDGDEDEDDEDDDDDKKKSKKSESDGDSDEGVTEGITVMVSVPPDEFYATIVKLYTELYKKSSGNNASDAMYKFTKGSRVNIQDFRKVRATGKKSFSRVINVDFDTAAKIIRGQGFKSGTAKMLHAGLFFVKKLKDGYVEVQLADGYKAEYDTVYTGGAVASNGNSAYGSATGMKYLKQSQVIVWYRPKANKSMRERYSIEESTGLVNGKTSLQINLEQLSHQKMERDLRRSHAGSVFEALLMFDRVGVEHDAIMEGTSVDLEQTMNAAMMEAIFQYTVIETMNTIGLYGFSSVDTANIRKALMEDMNALSADKNNSTKKTRINTMKYKRNTDADTMSAK